MADVIFSRDQKFVRDSGVRNSETINRGKERNRRRNRGKKFEIGKFEIARLYCNSMKLPVENSLPGVTFFLSC